MDLTRRYIPPSFRKQRETTVGHLASVERFRAVPPGLEFSFDLFPALKRRGYSRAPPIRGWLGSGPVAAAKAGYRVDVNAEKNGFDGLVRHVHAALGHRVEPPVMALLKKLAGMGALLGELRLS